MASSIAGIQLNDRLELATRFVPTPARHSNAAQVQNRLWMIWLQSQCFHAMRFRLPQLAQRPMSLRQVAVKLSSIRAQSDCFADEFDRPGMVAALLRDDSQQLQ